MAYDRYDRDERSRWSNNDRSDQSRHQTAVVTAMSVVSGTARATRLLHGSAMTRPSAAVARIRVAKSGQPAKIVTARSDATGAAILIALTTGITIAIRPLMVAAVRIRTSIMTERSLQSRRIERARLRSPFTSGYVAFQAGSRLGPRPRNAKSLHANDRQLRRDRRT